MQQWLHCRNEVEDQPGKPDSWNVQVTVGQQWTEHKDKVWFYDIVHLLTAVLYCRDMEPQGGWQKRLLTTELRCCRRILKICWRDNVSNISIRQRLQRHSSVVGIIARRKLQLFGHICRMGNDKLIKTVMLGMVDRDRSRGQEDGLPGSASTTSSSGVGVHLLMWTSGPLDSKHYGLWVYGWMDRLIVYFSELCFWQLTLVGATNVLQSTTGKLLGVKDRMEVGKYHRKVDNKARESHHLTMQDLREIQRVSLSLHFCILWTYLYSLMLWNVTGTLLGLLAKSLKAFIFLLALF